MVECKRWSMIATRPSLKECEKGENAFKKWLRHSWYDENASEIIDEEMVENKKEKIMGYEV